MFNKGASLTSGLIDQDRLFTIMNKVKTLASKSKVINYREVADYTT